MSAEPMREWQFWQGLSIARVPLRYIIRPAKLRARRQMKEFSGSAYVFRMFELFFGLRYPPVVERLTDRERKDLSDFTERFDAMPWRPLVSHPHISELPDDDLRALIPSAKRLDRRLWLRTGRSIVPFVYRVVHGWKRIEFPEKASIQPNQPPDRTRVDAVEGSGSPPQT